MSGRHAGRPGPEGEQTRDEHPELVVWMRRHRVALEQAFTAQVFTYVCALDGVLAFADNCFALQPATTEGARLN